MERIDWDHPAIDANGIRRENEPYYPVLWLMPNGEVAGLHRLAYHWTVHVGLEPIGYRDRYCFRDAVTAMAAFDAWDGKTGDPLGWTRHPKSGRRRLPVEEFRAEHCFPDHGSTPYEVMPGFMEWVAH